MPIANPKLIKPVIGNIYMRDYLSGHFSQYTSPQKPSTRMSISKTDPTMCTCNNILEEAVYKFYVNRDFTALTNVTIDVVVGVNIINKCKSKYLFEQKYSSKFILDSDVS